MGFRTEINLLGDKLSDANVQLGQQLKDAVVRLDQSFEERIKQLDESFKNRIDQVSDHLRQGIGHRMQAASSFVTYVALTVGLAVAGWIYIQRQA